MGKQGAWEPLSYCITGRSGPVRARGHTIRTIVLR